VKLKKGDKVQVISGSQRGTIGEILKVIPEKNQVVVEGVNLQTKHLKPTQANPDGGKTEKEAPINASNVLAYDSKAKKASRIGYKQEKGKKVRIYKQTGAVVK
jgi:large subunit ribosomal protein L24